MTTYKWLSHWKTCTSGSMVKSWPMMSKVSGSNPAATKVFFRGLNDVYVCHVTWNTKMTTSDRKKKFSTWNHIENACRKLTESWDGSSLIRSSSRRPWNFPDGQMVPGRYPDAVCYQGTVPSPTRGRVSWCADGSLLARSVPSRNVSMEFSNISIFCTISSVFKSWINSN